MFSCLGSTNEMFYIIFSIHIQLPMASYEFNTSGKIIRLDERTCQLAKRLESTGEL